MRWLVLLLIPLLAGCLGGGTGPDAVGGDEADAAGWPRCEHPWPCGDGSEWSGPAPPGEDGWPLRLREQARAELDTGVTLDGALWWPEVPEGVDVPVLLWATPYAGQCRYSSLEGAVYGVVEDQDPPATRFDNYCEDPPYDNPLGDALFGWVGSQGYAMAMFNVRGTGLSGGCFDYYGSESQRDLAALVEWLAALPGTNGRVGMWGISAMGTTPWMAAVHAPPSLKAITPSGIISDLYLNRFTPQGATYTDDAFGVMWSTQNSVVPAGGTLNHINVAEEQTFIQNQLERGCPNAVDNASTFARAKYTDDRAHDWWEDRRLVKDFGSIEAAVLVQHGQWEGGHRYQEDAIWDHIDAPKRFLLGPWGHVFNLDEEELGRYPHASDSRELYLGWFDFWLKGLGDPPRVGVVDILDRDGKPDEVDAWPPDATARALYLGDGGLTDAPTGPVSFRSVPDQGGDLCTAADGEVPAIVLESEPLAAPVHVMGNAMAYLELTSDLPGGLVVLDLYAIGPDGACHADFDLLEAYVSDGAGDLRHLDGRGDGEDFPTGTATGVRLDLMSVSVRVEAGHRLVAVLSGSGVRGYEGSPYAPTLTVGPGSHILLPLAEGDVGAEPPEMDYPPRPRV